MNFTVEDSFWELFPDAKIGVVIAENIDNSIKNNEKYLRLLNEAVGFAGNYLKNEDFSSNRVISVWREAFSKFKTKKGARSSIEALFKRVKKGNEFNNINPLVDIYNSISIKYALPCGGEDIDTFVGNVRLTKADGTEHFVVLGSEEISPPLENEIVYKDDAGAICRCLNWRESSRTMLTENTKNAFLCIELVDKSRVLEFENALNELSGLIAENMNGTNRIEILDKNKKIIGII